MEIVDLELKNFRNYDNKKIKFSNKLNLIYGNNGSGKTNLVEAIYILALTKSFRTNEEKTLIKIGSNTTSIKGTLISKEEKTKYEISIDDDKRVFIDGDRIKKISDYITRINIVLYNPLDNHIISDSPSYRRRVLNIEISQINKEYLLLLNAYNKILKHRNAYLKQLYLNSNASKDYLNILTKKLVDYGIKIYDIRKKYLEDINKYLGKIYKQIFSYGELEVRYKSTFKNKNVDNLLDIFKKNYNREMAFGKTLYGVHHDDFEFILDGVSLEEYGSVGQQKNAILSFKLSEIEIIKDIIGEFPILILDDLFSELDEDKVNNIIKLLDNNIQTFITTTDINKINNKLLEKCTLLDINKDVLEEK